MKIDKLVNLTPHQVMVRADRTPDDRIWDGSLWTIESSGVARLEELDSPDGYLAEFPVILRRFGGIVGLPEPCAGTAFIVSMPVAQLAAEMGREDVVAPDSGATAIRENGKIVAVRGFVRFVSAAHCLSNVAIISMVEQLAIDVASETAFYDQGFRDIIAALAARPSNCTSCGNPPDYQWGPK